MGKIIPGLILGFLIGLGCRYFDIPLPSPPKLVGALVVLSMTFGYVGMDYLLVYHAKKTAGITRPVTTEHYCGGPSGLPPSIEQEAVLAENAPSPGRDRAK